jgi:hypothetical protein
VTAMNKFLPRNLSIALAAVAIAAGGCGGGSDSGATPLSQEDFVSQANAICADFNSQLGSLQQPTPGDFDALAQFATDTLAAVQPAIVKFHALTPPEDLQDKWDAYLAGVQKGVTVIQKLEQAAEAQDGQQVTSLATQLGQINNDAEATALGLTECAKDPGE